MAQKSLRDRLTSAVFAWMVEEGTPSKIASMVVYMLGTKELKRICEDENISY